MKNNYVEHPWLKNYPILPKHKHLIIGTHPPMPYNGKIHFYYGNMNEFWRFLERAYGESIFFNSQGQPELNSILNWLNNKDIALTDMLQYTCNSFSTDTEMEINSDEQFNQDLQLWLENSNIENIFFTSFSNGKSAYGLFRKWCKKTFRIRLPDGKEVIDQGNCINIEINGRKIRLFMLYSPSPAARRGIPSSLPFIKWLSLNPTLEIPTDAFRIYWYKEYFKSIVN
jgi:G:T/U-mismatch repair DNA glycosylase